MDERTGIERVGIIGLGYVGLPLAVAFAEAGLEVVGLDTNPKRVLAANEGVSYVEDVCSEQLGFFTATGRLRATADPCALETADAVLICLPTPLNDERNPDLSAVISGAETAARHLKPGGLLVLESTTYPGTTREIVLPIVERGAGRLGEDFFLAFGSERVDPASREFGLHNTPKVVGGMSAECARRARTLYRKIAPEVHLVSDPESAELSKLLENTFRAVNIALVNELAVLCDRMGMDVWEVIEAAATKPFGFMPFSPGPGLGGHCIPIDPFYLSWRARDYDTDMEFIELAGRVNARMPHYAAERVRRTLEKEGKPLRDSEILLLGVSYKPEVSDLRGSPALKLLELLRQAGARVRYHDPYVPVLSGWGLSSVALTKEELRSCDCAVIVTDHPEVDLQTVVGSALTILDLRNAVRRRLCSRPCAAIPHNVEVL